MKHGPEGHVEFPLARTKAGNQNHTTGTDYPSVMPAHPGPAFGRPECMLVAGIHVLKAEQVQRRGWPGLIRGSSPRAAMTVWCVGF